LSSPRVVFLAGPHFAGKSSCADVMQAHLGSATLDCGPYLRSLAAQSGASSFNDFVKDGERAEGENFTDSLLLRRVFDDLKFSEQLVVVGSRSVRGLRYLTEHIRASFPEASYLTIYMEASREVLWERFKSRDSGEDRNLFERLLLIDFVMGVEDIRDIADVVVDSSRSVEETSRVLLSLLSRLDSSTRTRLSPARELSLNDVTAFVKADSVINDAVRVLDPLRVSGIIGNGFMDGFDECLRSIEAVPRLNRSDSLTGLALMRDYKFIATAGSRLGRREDRILMQRVAELAAQFGESSRETFVDYVCRNPRGTEMRTFSGGDLERAFIRGAGEVDEDMREAAMQTLHALGTGHHDLGGAISRVQHASAVMSALSRVVSAEAFARNLRPMYDATLVNGVLSLGPHGGQSSITLLDAICAGIVAPCGEAAKLFDESVASLPEVWRPILSAIRKSVLHLWSCGALGDDEIRVQLAGLIQAVRGFRQLHRGVSRVSFRHRSSGAVGSGGFPSTVLDEVLAWMDQQIEALSVDGSS
jgi:cytidylate kinase